MTRRSVKQEKPSEDAEEVVMLPSTRPKRTSRVELWDRNTDMAEAPSTWTNDFPAMPTPATSFGGDNMTERAATGQQPLSVTGKLECIEHFCLTMRSS